jgi:hypothetical protein
MFFSRDFADAKVFRSANADSGTAFSPPNIPVRLRFKKITQSVMLRGCCILYNLTSVGALSEWLRLMSL